MPASASPTPPPNTDCSGDAVVAKLTVVEDRAAANMLAVALQALSPGGTARCLVDAFRSSSGSLLHNARRVFVVGGPGAISDSHLRSGLGLTAWTRIAGATRWGTQAEVAGAILDLAAGQIPLDYDPNKSSPNDLPPNTDCSGNATVTKLSVIEDRAAANMLAEAFSQLGSDSPRCLIDAGDPSQFMLPPSSAKSELAKASKVYVVGGTGAIPNGWLRSCLGVTRAIRIAGADRWATQAEVAKTMIRLVKLGSRSAVSVPEATSTCERPAPGPPRDLSVSIENGNDLRVSWKRPANYKEVPIDLYEVRITGDASSGLDMQDGQPGSYIWVSDYSRETFDFLKRFVKCGRDVELHIRVRAGHSEAGGPPGEVAELKAKYPASCTGPPKPSSPKNLRVSMVNSNDLRVQWNKPSNAGSARVNRYQIKITGGDNSQLNWSSWRDASGDASGSLQHLVPYVSCGTKAELDIRVRARTVDNRTGDAARLKTAIPKECRTPPNLSAPRDLHLQVANDDDLWVRWGPPSNANEARLSHYEIKITGGDKSELRMSGFGTVPGGIFGTGHRVPDVSCSQSVTLSVQVRAVSASGKIGEAASLQNGFPCVPEERLRAPQNLQLTVENDDDLRVSWSAPSNAGSRPRVSHYEIRITGGDKSELRMSGFGTVPGGSSGTSHRVPDVSCSQSVTLSVQVRAVSASGKIGEAASLQNGFPCVPEERLRAPQSLRVSIENNDDLKVSWSAPSNASSRPSVGRYEVQITGGDKSGLRMRSFTTVSGGSSARSHLVRDVSCKPDVELEISVRAVSSSGKQGDVARFTSRFPNDCRPSISGWEYVKSGNYEHYRRGMYDRLSLFQQPKFDVGCLGSSRILQISVYANSSSYFDDRSEGWWTVLDGRSHSSYEWNNAVEIWEPEQVGSSRQGYIVPPSDTGAPELLGYRWQGKNQAPTYSSLYLSFFYGIVGDDLTDRDGYLRVSTSNAQAVFDALPCW